MNGSVTYEGNTLLSGAINVNAGGNVEALNVQVTENGTRTIEAPAGVDGYNPITIDTNVPIPVPVLDSIEITQNGIYTPPTGTDGYNDIKVEVPEPVLISKTITENGTYTPGVGTDGYNEIIVNVQSQTPVFTECCKNLELIDSSGVNQGWKQFDAALSDSHRYLILLFMQNQGGSPFGYLFQPNFAQFPTMEVYIQLQYSQFLLNVQSNRLNAGSSHNAGVKVTVLQIPDDYIISPF